MSFLKRRKRNIVEFDSNWLVIKWLVNTRYEIPFVSDQKSVVIDIKDNFDKEPTIEKNVSYEDVLVV
jgi:hypothetical protein